MKIWIDNDACPRQIREIVFKGGQRIKADVVVVGNSYMRLPPGTSASMICVGSGHDAADDYIANNVDAHDLVITADVPLADRVVTKGAVALSPRGELFDPESIKEKLVMRNLAQELRSAGTIQGGPSSLGTGDIKRFAAAFDRYITKRSKG